MIETFSVLAVFIIFACVVYFYIKNENRKRDIARKQQELLDNTDELTQISNTKFIDDMLDKEIERAKRHGASLSFVILEIDHFGELRSEYGRQFTRRILKDTAENLQEKIRAYDVLAREKHRFLCLFPETGRESALLLAKRARAVVSAERHYFRVDGDPIYVTASVGATSCKPGKDSKINMNRIRITAEKALTIARQKASDRLEYLQTEEA